MWDLVVWDTIFQGHDMPKVLIRAYNSLVVVKPGPYQLRNLIDMDALFCEVTPQKFGFFFSLLELGTVFQHKLIGYNSIAN